MTKLEELNLFTLRADELIESKYILADIKIVNLLKSIAVSETLVAIFKNSLSGFDYEAAKKKYLVKSPYMSEEKGEFVLPPNSKELLAFIFNILMDIDAKRINFGEFLDKYFYEDGSAVSGYNTFVNSMIKPFKNSVKILMEGVISGKVQDPMQAVQERDEKIADENEKKQKEEKLLKEQSNKIYGEAIKNAKRLLLLDKKAVRESKLSEEVKSELDLIIDMMGNAIDSEDTDIITYAFVAYKYMAKAHPVMFYGKRKKLEVFIRDIINGI